MDRYEWKKNKAVVDRLYYSEQVLRSTTIATGLFTTANLILMRGKYAEAACRARIIPAWRYWAIFNVVVLSMLLRPLTKEEI